MPAVNLHAPIPLGKEAWHVRHKHILYPTCVYLTLWHYAESIEEAGLFIDKAKFFLMFQDDLEEWHVYETNRAVWEQANVLDVLVMRDVLLNPKEYENQIFMEEEEYYRSALEREE
jgi:hypothetical protein